MVFEVLEYQGSAMTLEAIIWNGTSNTCLRISLLHDKFETDRTIMGVRKGRSGRPRTSTSEASSVALLDSFRQRHHNLHMKKAGVG
ncbi:hypothetical protein TNCV_2681371 [Trichonephila clavipes]|uniref:Uncharacterized protein n=1 Tax=Trichonephila clavipes TaxID=2585209 RepID=A0A8X6VBD7_TRICX|nr:hypothetical protein TNCV_2681371 [Trichonephila clavipes]